MVFALLLSFGSLDVATPEVYLDVAHDALHRLIMMVTRHICVTKPFNLHSDYCLDRDRRFDWIVLPSLELPV